MSDIDDDLFGMDKRALEQYQALQANDVYAMDETLRKAFSTPNGRKALQYMEDVSRQVGADPALGFDKGAAMGFAREGQSQLVWDLKTRMKRAEAGPPKQPEQQED